MSNLIVTTNEANELVLRNTVENVFTNESVTIDHKLDIKGDDLIITNEQGEVENNDEFMCPEAIAELKEVVTKHL